MVSFFVSRRIPAENVQLIDRSESDTGDETDYRMLEWVALLGYSVIGFHHCVHPTADRKSLHTIVVYSD
jgi:hypothetical protein